MCGIGGHIRFDNKKVETEFLEQIGNSIEHRGRDFAGYYVRDNIGLVHRRLAIIDLTPAGNQPMISQNGKYIIVFNGEILNYKELRNELIGKGHNFKSNSDTEVILQSYEEFGLNLLDKIDGMYAFSLIDFETKKIYLVRDRLGIKPLYYYENKDSLTFSSEIKGIVNTGICSVEIDPFAFYDYLNIQLYTQDKTLFKGIKSVDPGTFISIDLNNYKVKKHKYWDIPEEEFVHMDYNEAIESLRGMIKDSVSLWSRSDVPIAAYVSGGLDSSIVSTYAKQSIDNSIQQNLFTFSSIFPNTNFRDERPFSDAMANFLGSDHHRIILSRDELVNAHRDLLYVLDMPVAGYASPYRVFSKIVRKYVKVVLTGHGGDEFFGGYPRYIIAALSKHITDSYKGIDSSFDMNNIKYIKGFEEQSKLIFSGSLFSDDRKIISSLFNRSGHLWDYVHPDIKKEIGDYSYIESMLDKIKDRKTSFLKKLLYLDAKVLLPGLLHVEDRTSMIENLESRTPLLDKRIVEFAGRLPESYLFRDGLKGMIRKASEPVLPKMITSNPSKSGTVYPIAEMIDYELKDLLQEDLKILDQSGLFIESASKMLGERTELVNKRITWALWSMGSWIKAFRPRV